METKTRGFANMLLSLGHISFYLLALHLAGGCDEVALLRMCSVIYTH